MLATYKKVLLLAWLSIMIQWNSIVHCGGVIKLSLFLYIMVYPVDNTYLWFSPPAPHDLCTGSSHYPGAAHWSVVCHLQHQVLSCRHSRQSHH